MSPRSNDCAKGLGLSQFYLLDLSRAILSWRRELQIFHGVVHKQWHGQKQALLEAVDQQHVLTWWQYSMALSTNELLLLSPWRFKIINTKVKVVIAIAGSMDASGTGSSELLVWFPYALFLVKTIILPKMGKSSTLFNNMWTRATHLLTEKDSTTASNRSPFRILNLQHPADGIESRDHMPGTSEVKSNFKCWTPIPNFQKR